MSDRKIIAVVGATGAQGGGVVRAIAAHPDGGFSARAITRDPSSDAAKALAALPNVEVVQADADDEASLERAFAGCHGAFCVTFFWVALLARARDGAGAEHGGRREGRRRPPRGLVDARGHAPVRHRRPHADPPGQVQGAALRRQGGRRRRVPRRRRADDVPAHGLLLGELHLLRRSARSAARTACSRSRSRWATARLPGIAAEDIGKTAYGIFTRGDELIGKTISHRRAST